MRRMCAAPGACFLAATPYRRRTAVPPPYRCCRLRNEKIPAKYTQREAGWHDSIDADVKGMLAGAVGLGLGRCVCG